MGSQILNREPIGIHVETVIGIDPGATGAISWINLISRKTKVIKMPKETNQIAETIMMAGEGSRFVFLEQVGIFRQDEHTPGMQYGIAKMLKNYNTIQAALELTKTPYILIHPKTWQQPYKGSARSRETKPERKRRFARIANHLYPEMKTALYAADAVLIMNFAIQRLSWAPGWVYSRSSETTKQMDIWKWKQPR